MGGLLKLGLLCDIELRWNTTSFLSQTDASGTHETFGDNSLGTEIRFHRQTRQLPTMEPDFRAKRIVSKNQVPSADETIANNGLQLCIEDTLCQFRKWSGHWTRGPLIHFRRKREDRAFQSVL